jgi:hypothetical protein
VREFATAGARGRTWKSRARTWARLASIAPAAAVRAPERGLFVGMAAYEVGLARGWLAGQASRRRTGAMASS